MDEKEIEKLPDFLNPFAGKFYVCLQRIPDVSSREEWVPKDIFYTGLSGSSDGLAIVKSHPFLLGISSYNSITPIYYEVLTSPNPPLDCRGYVNRVCAEYVKLIREIKPDSPEFAYHILEYFARHKDGYVRSHAVGVMDPQKHCELIAEIAEKAPCYKTIAKLDPKLNSRALLNIYNKKDVDYRDKSCVMSQLDIQNPDHLPFILEAAARSAYADIAMCAISKIPSTGEYDEFLKTIADSQTGVPRSAAMTAIAIKKLNVKGNAQFIAGAAMRSAANGNTALAKAAVEKLNPIEHRNLLVQIWALFPLGSEIQKLIDDRLESKTKTTPPPVLKLPYAT